ncbi:GNAT family N-acetyltransferase [Halalkalibacter nanhaiisediminis]|uniref:Putative GNAT superfamily acetyltransferase n=1 Tax=Halalkalibacter nanhaiisediminis TaxID=688079 RepID=A0A562QN57_9BACI|nr:GNAT family N-acetyltransferase [Halalkalibacter nanhaiisediminis]TWI58201.1 putative GNAT superfamily acetyltransferase [Halalkalibacter nanhaiisediminis]
MVMTESIMYRKIDNIKEIQEVVSFQEEIWSRDAVSPLPQLVAASHHGGVIMGAFHAAKLVGFSYGFSGYKNKEHYLISHMTAISPSYQNLGIGLALKLKQRDWAIEYGYKKIVWTYDPLESRNAYFNINKLGGYVKTHLPSYYGEMNDKLNNGLPTDRFVVEWDICSDRVKNALAGLNKLESSDREYSSLLTIKVNGGLPYPHEENLIKNQKSYLIPVPVDFQKIKQVDFEVAKAWRLKFRNAASDILLEGYKVTRILKTTNHLVHYYVLEYGGFHD